MKNLRVFIVDDDVDFAESLALVLEGRGCVVSLAHSGEDAVRRFRDEDFDIAFMDVKLPGMNGVESFMQIRRIKPAAKVIMMTGYSLEDLLARAVENGAWAVLNKPLDLKRVLGMIEKLGAEGILIADDNLDMLESLRRLLEDKGYRIFQARNGREAVDGVVANEVDLLILDLRMPVLNGLETFLELKRIGRAVPTVIVTGFADEETEAVDSLRSMSVYGILRKPFNPRDLLSAVEGLLNHQ